ncbi:MAG TPA: hypothetical protein GXX55_10580 [Firmicutes bacterium]|nr:hypothetical protein [Bacillota bacterium]
METVLGGHDGRVLADIELVDGAVRKKRMPQRIETEVLIRCRRRCCLCYGLNRDLGIKLGQIAHLDHDPGNGNPDNLVFLCLEHHNVYDSRFRQSKGITEGEVRHFRNELLALIDYVWKQPVAINRVRVHPIGDISGRYIRDAAYENAELQIDVVAPNRARVIGFALWGTNRECGPNIGELDFEAPICDGKIVYTGKPLRGKRRYKLQLTFQQDRLIAEENAAVGYFGLNVSFAGQYVRIE